MLYRLKSYKGICANVVPFEANTPLEAPLMCKEV